MKAKPRRASRRPPRRRAGSQDTPAEQAPAPAPAPTPEPAGLGGVPATDRTITDLKLAEQALHNGWPIDDRIRTLVVTQATLIAGRSTSERNRIAAMRVLVSADRNNVAAKRPADGTQVNVQVNVLLDQIHEYADVLDRLDAQLPQGAIPADGAQQPVDPAETHPQANGLPVAG